MHKLNTHSTVPLNTPKDQKGWSILRALLKLAKESHMSLESHCLLGRGASWKFWPSMVTSRWGKLVQEQ